MDSPLCPFSEICQKLEWLSYHNELADAIPKTMAAGKRTATTISEVFIVTVVFRDWRNCDAAHPSYTGSSSHLRVATAPSLPNVPITQLSPYFTRKPGM